MSNYINMNNITDNAAKTYDELILYCKMLEEENAELKAKNNWLMEQFKLARQNRFGSSSERYINGQQQLLDEDELQAMYGSPPSEPEVETIVYNRRKKQRGHRDAVFADIPTTVIEYRLTDEELVCHCGDIMHEIGKKVRQELKMVPAELFVEQHVSFSYACYRCEKEGISTPVVTAPVPAPVLPYSYSSPSSIAYIMTQKYVEGLPLYRQEQYFLRKNIQLSRQTMSNWMLLASEKWLQIIYNRMHHYLLEQDILHADETTIQVLREADRDADTKSYMWLYRTGREGPAIILFDYQETRAVEHPRNFLNGFSGYIHCDGYKIYELLLNIILIGCWSHARRYFVDALNVLPKENRSGSLAQKGLEACNEIFTIERTLKDVSNDKRYEARLEKSRPVLDAFYIWLISCVTVVLPKSALGKAIRYCLNQWDKLGGFLLDGRLEADNNRGERTLKPYVIGRKNWLFANTPRGAKASATIYSVMETAKENGLDPFAYLCHVFRAMPNMDITDMEALDKLLPWSPDIPAECRAFNKNNT